MCKTMTECILSPQYTNFTRQYLTIYYHNKRDESKTLTSLECLMFTVQDSRMLK